MRFNFFLLFLLSKHFLCNSLFNLKQWLINCGSWTRSINIIQKLRQIGGGGTPAFSIRSWVSVSSTDINKPSKWFWYILKLIKITVLKKLLKTGTDFWNLVSWSQSNVWCSFNVITPFTSITYGFVMYKQMGEMECV